MLIGGRRWFLRMSWLGTERRRKEVSSLLSKSKMRMMIKLLKAPGEKVKGRIG